MYIFEYRPDAFFEQFLIHCLFIRTENVKKHPFRATMMKKDFKQFMELHLHTIHAMFDFYAHESTQGSTTNKYRPFCIHLDNILALLRDLGTIGNENGLNKHSIKKILDTVQLPNNIKDNEKSSKKDDNKSKHSDNQTSYKKSALSQNTKGTPKEAQKQQVQLEIILNSGDNYFIFFEFVEMLYLVAQYHNPDPFVNQNQKFALFLEQNIIANMKIKMKGKKLLDSPQKATLVKQLQGSKVVRGANLETFTSFIELH